MKSYVRLYNGLSYQEVIPPMTTQGVPLLPSIGETIRANNENYLVTEVIWEYSEGFVVVNAHRS